MYSGHGPMLLINFVNWLGFVEGTIVDFCVFVPFLVARLLLLCIHRVFFLYTNTIFLLPIKNKIK